MLRPYRIRTMLRRGTIAGLTALPSELLKRSVNAAPPGAWSARTYIPEPVQRAPVTLIALPAAAIGKSGKASGKSAGSWLCSELNVARKCQILYFSSAGAAKLGRSDTQFASPQRLTVVANGWLVCVATFAVPIEAVRTSFPATDPPN